MEGYDKLASLMGDHPELATFRRFASLNAKNLLYLQAELTYLESKLRRLAHEDHVSSDEQKKLYAGDWYFLMTSYEDDESEQWSVMLKAREKLKEYSGSLVDDVFDKSSLLVFSLRRLLKNMADERCSHRRSIEIAKGVDEHTLTSKERSQFPPEMAQA